MKPRNFVHKHMQTFNHATVERDRTKYSRSNDWREEYAEDLEFLEKHEDASISDKAYTSFFNKGNNMSSKISMLTLTRMFWTDKHPDDELVKINSVSQNDATVSIYFRRAGKAMHTKICKADMVLWLIQQ